MIHAILTNGSTRMSAYYTTRLGYLNGFRQIGEKAILMNMYDIQDGDYAFWLGCHMYEVFTEKDLDIISRHPHYVGVGYWFDGMEDIRGPRMPTPTHRDCVVEAIDCTKPSFLWCSAPEPWFHYYHKWTDRGHKLISLPWACDDTLYFPVDDREFEDVEVAFVGNYRPYKEQQYADYLYPYDTQFFGNNQWPMNYNGYLDDDKERVLYRNSTVCPTLSEPQFTITGDTVERPFKVLGSGGLTVFDCVPSYRELFSDDEALLPKTLSEYHQMMKLALSSKVFNRHYRETGRRAVLERHTYAHRCRKVLECL